MSLLMTNIGRQRDCSKRCEYTCTFRDSNDNKRFIVCSRLSDWEVKKKGRSRFNPRRHFFR
jgi:hypothetical protein